MIFLSIFEGGIVIIFFENLRDGIVIREVVLLLGTRGIGPTMQMCNFIISGQRWSVHFGLLNPNLLDSP